MGIGKEICVARHLQTHSGGADCLTVMDIAQGGMPAVKSNGVISVQPITRQQWLVGKCQEQSNFYLQRLFRGGKGGDKHPEQVTGGAGGVSPPPTVCRYGRFIHTRSFNYDRSCSCRIVRRRALPVRAVRGGMVWECSFYY